MASASARAAPPTRSNSRAARKIKAVFDNENAALAHSKAETAWKVDGSEAGLTGGVCERTLAVRDALVSAAGVDDCSDVTITVLGRIADLDFSGDGLGELKAGDFDGLDELEELDLSDNSLASLPSGLFADLEKLETLKLGGNALTALPAGIFRGLTSLEELRLGGNPVGSFPLGIFSGLAALRILDLEDMGLTGLRGTVFGALAALEDLDLKNNRLTSLPASVFAGRGALVILDLEGNDLANLNPAGLFEGLDALEDLDLRDNELTTFVRGTFFGAEGLVTLSLQNNRIAALPDRIFELMTALEDLDFSGNPGASDFRPDFAVSGPARVSAQQTAALTATPGANPWGTNLLWDWVRTDADAVSLTLAGTQTAALSFEAPSLAADAAVAFTVTGTGRGTAASRSRDAEVTIDATASATGVAITSLPVEGDTYRRDETIELTVTFTERVFVNGTPELGLRIGSGNGGAQQAAAYDRGTGTTELVFVYTVAQADLDNDGVTVDAGGLTLPNGATIRNVDLETAVLGNARIRFLDANVDGRTPAAMGGICDRTRELREALVSLASGVASCADMDAAALAALPASLDLSNRGIAALKPGDFAGLGHVTSLNLRQNELADLTPGVLDPLTALTGLGVNNNQIARLPPGVFDPLSTLTRLELSANEIAVLVPGAFDRLTKLQILNLSSNQLTALPDGIFEPLTEMFELTLGNNPGSADWLPTAAAVAEVEGGITELWEGREITLDGSASASGPWGSNLVYAWSASRSLPVEYGDASAARTTATLTDTGGAGGPFHYTLSVSGRGTAIRDASTATLPLTVVSQPTITGVAFTSTPREGSAKFSTYYLGEPIEVTVTFSAPVTVTGVPYLQIQLFDDDDTIDDRRRADYVRTVDGNRLVFAYEVQAADDSGEDIAVCGTGDHASCESRLHLPAGAAIHAGDGVVPARLGFAGLEPGSHTYGVYGATAAPTGGICERTPQIRDEIVTVLVDYGWTGVSDCGDVTPEVMEYAACEEVTFDFSTRGSRRSRRGISRGSTAPNARSISRATR